MTRSTPLTGRPGRTNTGRRSGAAAALAAVAGLGLAACGTTSGTPAEGGSAPSTRPTLSASGAPAATIPAPATGSPTADPSAPSAPPTAVRGSYVGYADWSADRAAYAGTKVVLFFAASWCPTCQRADENLTADPAAIPAGLTIVKTDYDAETGLRQEYGVTVQHTFVQIDDDGEALARWTGSETAEEIAGQVQ